MRVYRMFFLADAGEMPRVILWAQLMVAAVLPKYIEYKKNAQSAYSQRTVSGTFSGKNLWENHSQR